MAKQSARWILRMLTSEHNKLKRVKISWTLLTLRLFLREGYNFLNDPYIYTTYTTLALSRTIEFCIFPFIIAVINCKNIILIATWNILDRVTEE